MKKSSFSAKISTFQGRSVHERACKECYVSMGGVSEMSDDKTPEREFNDVPGSSTERHENNDATNNAPQNALTTPSVHSNNSSSSTPQKIATASPKPSMSQNQSYSPSQAVKGWKIKFSQIHPFCTIFGNRWKFLILIGFLKIVIFLRFSKLTKQVLETCH